MNIDIDANEPSNAGVDDVMVFTQWTPNPNAFKFIVSEFVIASGKATFQDMEQVAHIPLVYNILSLDGVTQVHLYENVITVTQDGSQDWEPLAESIEQVVKMYLPLHDTKIDLTKKRNRDHLSEELKQIEEILDRTIRPGLQADGGDVEVVDLAGDILRIRYEGACGTCPSSMAGTLNAITSFLRAEFRESLDVVAI